MMILLLFYEMKLLAFIGDFFTAMLPLLLFFYSSLLYSLLLCLAPLFCFFFFFNPYSLYPVSSALLSCYPCAVLILF
ncbi:hypothetical protein PPACK8108_LOCUS25806 [Phakopsora pachyrhizi]|uniref:Uncharacterized protein n=1 Tax=Phakopsora pachyrhizi TaxID=170000 RepID=A0AAV0BUK9_PHAPC|nr:hypothetical protein PPACK8108_LOCUS25806 [Phakopsora pachyrhizi]